MKTFKNIRKAILPILIVFCGISVYAQKNTTPLTKEIIEAKQFVFKAQTAIPSNGSTVQLTSPYDLRLLNDSVVAYLPYYGRAYNVSYGSEGGIKFTSTQFQYKIKSRKKGGWDVTITPKDAADVRQLFLTIFSNGSASLQVLSNDRQPINFQGSVIANKDYRPRA
jgi:hypothetical protein